MMRRRGIMLSLQLLLFLGILFIMVYGFTSTDQGLGKEEAEARAKRAKEAIQKAALECYSIEGAYPQSLEYLKKHYGLYVQESAYRIRYQYIGANIMPDMDVYPRSEQP